VFEAQRSRLLPLGQDGQQRLAQELARFAEVVDGWRSVGQAAKVKSRRLYPVCGSTYCNVYAVAIPNGRKRPAIWN
jgi:hypothetical protein